MNEMQGLFEQFGLSLLFYIGVIFLFRLVGKRLAGQTTTLDLIGMASLSVAL